jgi:hypothetical protein
MNVSSYFRSLSAELDALKDRIRYLIEDGHWLTDGEGKESILRTILTRHLPANVQAARGFVIDLDWQSTQIDILLYDNSKPALYRDGDLVFITPEAVKGIIEVKTSVDNHDLDVALMKLAKNCEHIEKEVDHEIFVGLFSYEAQIGHHPTQNILERLCETARGRSERVVNHVCLGKDLFFRYWTQHPDGGPPREGYNSWHAYNVEGMARGYFLQNVIDSASGPEMFLKRGVWYPLQSKELHLVGEISLTHFG